MTVVGGHRNALVTRALAGVEVDAPATAADVDRDEAGREAGVVGV
jgi:hypothetical protein